jgi:hypothetical protein
MASRFRLVTLSLAFTAIGCTAGPPSSPDIADTGGDPPRTSATCSASELSAALAKPQGLPQPVADVRLAIAEAAVACDYEALETLAIRDGEFVQSFSDDEAPDPGQAARAWWETEEAGDPILATLVRLLELPHATRGEDYVWPSAFAEEPTEADWRALEAMYTGEEIQSFRGFGGYVGLRIGISPDGEWQYFVAGD